MILISAMKFFELSNMDILSMQNSPYSTGRIDKKLSMEQGNVKI